MGKLSELIVKISANSDGFRQGMREVNADLLRTQSVVQRQTQGFANLGSGLQGFGGVLAASVSLPLAGLAIAATKAFSEIDSLKRALFTLEGTAAGTEARFTKLAKIAELPGLGLEQAVRGDIRLRAIGLTAEKSEQALLGIGKALASVGGGAADLDETIRQFGQLATSSSLTAENLKPLIERVPQAGKLLREAFGTANAEELRKLGVTSGQVVELLITEFNKLPPVTGGIKNALENLSQSGRIALAEVGKAIEPMTQAFVDGASAIIAKIPEITKAFTSLPVPAQTAAAGIAAIAFVGPLAIVAVGTVLSNLSAIVTGIGTLKAILQGLAATQLVSATTAMFAFQGSVTAASIAMGLLNATLAAIPYVLAVGSLAIIAKGLYDLSQARQYDERASASLQRQTEILIVALRQAGQPIDDLIQKKKAGTVTAGEYDKALKAMVESVAATKRTATGAATSVKGLADNTNTADKAVLGLANGTGKLNRVTLESEVLIAQQSLLVSEHTKRVNELAAARLKLALGPPMIEFGDLPDISTLGNKIPPLPLPVQFPSLDKLNIGVYAQEINDALSKVEQQGRSKDLKGYLQNLKGQFKDTSGIAKRAMQEVSTVITNVSQGLARAIFAGEGFGKTMVNVAKQIGQSLTAFVIQSLIQATGLLEGFDKLLTGVIKNIAGETAKKAAPVAVDAAVKAGAPSVTGAAGAAASSGIFGIITAVASVVSAVSDVFANFQFAAMNKSLDIIVKHTLQTANDLSNLRADEFRRKDELFSKLDSLLQFTWIKLDDITTAIQGAVSIGGSGGGGQNFTVNVNGGLILGQNAISQLADMLLGEFKIRGVVLR